MQPSINMVDDQQQPGRLLVINDQDYDLCMKQAMLWLN